MHNRSIRLPSILSCVLIIQRVSVFPLNKIFLSRDLELKWGFREERGNSEIAGKHFFTKYKLLVISSYTCIFKHRRVFPTLDLRIDLICSNNLDLLSFDHNPKLTNSYKLQWVKVLIQIITLLHFSTVNHMITILRIFTRTLYYSGFWCKSRK